MRNSNLKQIRHQLAPLKKTGELVLQRSARSSAVLAAFMHKLLFWWQWGIPPLPEHFDHQIDLFYYWRATRNSLWVERGVFGSVALDGGDVLELCCGDGFNARNFYSLRSRSVVACDFDPRAIRTARLKNRAPNVSYILADIRTEMPNGTYSTVVWDAAIEHFTTGETKGILREIKKRLAPSGILTGYTVTTGSGELQCPHHEHEWEDKEELAKSLGPFFTNLMVFETVYPMRHNLYFFAGDGAIPFMPGWPAAMSVTRPGANS